MAETIRLKNFDRYIAIDWSGAEKPVRNPAISVAKAIAGNTPPHLVVSNDKKPWSRNAVADWIVGLAESNIRTLVGIDCNFSYGEEKGFLQFEKGYSAYDLWDAVEDACQDHANYFAGPYWTHETHSRHFWIKGARPPEFLAFPRHTEKACRAFGLGHPESPFKLIGAKQVGKGGLSGMRLLRDLKRRLGNRIAVWPFDRYSDTASLTLVEIYPRLFLKKSGHGVTKVPDNDVGALNRVLRHAGSQDYDGQIFSDHESDALVSAAGLRMLCGTDKTVPARYSNPPVNEDVLKREGWIFGVAGEG